MDAARSTYSDLSGTTVHEQLNTRDVGAVVGREKYRRLAEIIWGREPAERNRRNHRGFFPISHKMRKAGLIPLGLTAANNRYARAFLTKTLAMPKPMPELPPVTTAILPASLPVIVISLSIAPVPASNNAVSSVT
jgi:hypothetical protein